MRNFGRALGWTALSLGLAALAPRAAPAEEAMLNGAAAYGDWTQDKPGLRRHLAPADLPPPYATRSTANGPQEVPRPAGAMPKVPPGFKVEAFAAGLGGPRLLRTAPNGDIFVAESREDQITVLRPGAGNQPPSRAVFARGLRYPFGIAFYPPGPDPRYLYIGDVSDVRRYPYRNGDTRARGAAALVVPSLPTGGHATRDIVFSSDGSKMFVSVGSASNDQEGGVDEAWRADILEFAPNGSGRRRFATGLRNPVGLALEPATGELWTAVNERDGLGDNLPPDYVTHLRRGGFYGWPWFYIGDHQDPRHAGEHDELREGITVPDVLLQPHSAPLHLAFYTGQQFPAEYRNDLFVALHGSWNRATRTGYKLVRVLMRDGKATGAYEDFMIGFVTSEGDVWGRPVGVAVAADGALLVSDDVANTVWRVSYVGGS